MQPNLQSLKDSSVANRTVFLGKQFNPFKGLSMVSGSVADHPTPCIASAIFKVDEFSSDLGSHSLSWFLELKCPSSLVRYRCCKLHHQFASALLQLLAQGFAELPAQHHWDS